MASQVVTQSQKNALLDELWADMSRLKKDQEKLEEVVEEEIEPTEPTELKRRGGELVEQNRPWQERLGDRHTSIMGDETLTPQERHALVAQATEDLKQLTEAERLAESAFRSFEASFANSFLSLIDGTQSAEEAFKSLARNVISDMVRIQAQAQAAQLTGMIGGWFSGLSGGHNFGWRNGRGPRPRWRYTRKRNVRFRHADRRQVPDQPRHGLWRNGERRPPVYGR